jgi:enoyl-CoA hydratase
VGRTYEPTDALVRGIVDELSAPEDLVSRAHALAAELAATPAASFSLTKRAMRLPGLDRARRVMDVDHDALMKAWSSAETHAAIREYLERTLTRK